MTPLTGGIINDKAEKKTVRQENGFSLVEVLISMTVLAIIVLTLISVLVYGFGALLRTRQVSLATQICKEQIDHVRNMPFADILMLGTTFSSAKLSELQSGAGSQAVENITPSGPPHIVKYSVAVAWLYHGRPLRKDVVTFITRNGVDKK